MRDDGDDIDNEAERWRDEKFSETPERREQEQREMVARAAQTKRDEVLAWCEQRALSNTKHPSLLPVTKSASPPQPIFDEGYWRGFILELVRSEMRGSEQALLKAVGRTIGTEFKKHDEELLALRAQVSSCETANTELRITVAELRGRLEQRIAEGGGSARPCASRGTTVDAAIARRRAAAAVAERRERAQLEQMEVDQAIYQ